MSVPRWKAWGKHCTGNESVPPPCSTGKHCTGNESVPQDIVAVMSSRQLKLMERRQLKLRIAQWSRRRSRNGVAAGSVPQDMAAGRNGVRGQRFAMESQWSQRAAGRNGVRVPQDMVAQRKLGASSWKNGASKYRQVRCPRASASLWQCIIAPCDALSFANTTISPGVPAAANALFSMSATGDLLHTEFGKTGFDDTETQCRSRYRLAVPAPGSTSL